jgi:oxalate---CoA ligase
MTTSEPAGDGRAVEVVASDVAELVQAQAAVRPHRGFVESATGSRRVTYGELQAVTRRWRDVLEDLGVTAGDRVGIAISDPVDFALVFLGVVAAGRVAAPIDPTATEREILSVCERTRPRLVVADRPAPGDEVEWVTMPAESFALQEAPDGIGDALPRHPADRGSAEVTGGVVLSTSGTSGSPKVIHLGQPALLHAARAVAGHHGLTPGDRGFNPLPLFHINAEVVGLLSTLVAGSTLILDDRFHRHGFWDMLGRGGVTWINAVPAILARVADLQDGEMVPDGIRFARSASAPLSLPVLERFERATGIPVVETYGMTEAASQITANPVDGLRKAGSVGRPVGVEVRVGSGEPDPGVVGPVGIRGPSVIGSYASSGYEDRFDAGGWLETGDLGYLDEDGYLFLVGRADDVINRGGEKIYPREVEDVVLADPAVVAVAVVGSDHEVLGRVPVAYLVVEGVSGPTARAVAEDVVARVQDRCARALSRPKRPAAFYVVASLPQGANGKIRRRAVAGEDPIYALLVQ